ncbi:MAG: 50S ribosomal protein L34e [Candidatus Aenigmatarchaeota archaeon]
MKKVKIKLPTKRIVIRKRKKKAGIPKCAICKKPLHGIPKLRSRELKKLSKSERKVERAYGGYLCSKCTREVMKERARKFT